MILLRLVGLLLDVLFLPLRALRRARAVPRGAIVRLEIDGAVRDVVPKPRWWELRQQKATSLWALARVVDAILADDRVKGLLVVLKELDCGMAGATSLRAELARLRAGGKEVWVHLPVGGGSKETYVATAGKILLGPAAQMAPLGFASTSRYVRRALDKAGIEPEVMAAGEYKSAGENLMRDAMSEPQREQVGRLLDAFHGALVDAIASGRGITAEAAAALVDGAPYFGQAAVDAGLADGVAHDDEVLARLGVDTKVVVPAAGYHALKRTPLLRAVRRPPVVAVIPVHGAIAHVASSFGGYATDERVAGMVRAARKDRRVKAVILHVDSPGGSALASDRMHHEIAQLAREKPLVCCMANVAASGGYYVAAPAHRIVCQETTVTGSIGVVAARLSAAPLLTRLGITTETVKRGARAGLLGATQPLSPDERGALEKEIRATYAAFVKVVATGRKRPEDEIERLARGRVWTGKDALEASLVDATGGFERALAEVRAMLPAALRDRVDPVLIRPPRRPVPVLDPPDKGEAGRRAVSALLAPFLSEAERTVVDLAAAGERVLAIFSGPVP